MKKWRQLAEEKTVLDQQTEEIHQKFRMDKINKEFGQLSGEELFRPITKRLDEKNTTVEEIIIIIINIYSAHFLCEYIQMRVTTKYETNQT